MNIKDEAMWPMELPGSVSVPGDFSFVYMLDIRAHTYRGFAEIEEGKGILRPRMSLASSIGQEAFRILFARGLEELWEAKYSQESAHRLEELIDSLNFVWSLLIIDPEHPPITDLSRDLYHAWQRGRDRISNGQIPDIEDSILCVFDAAGFVLEKLRNRAWQNNTQSLYFDGWHELRRFVSIHFEEISTWFSSWDEFVRYFLAKDNVLQFRLRTNY